MALYSDRNADSKHFSSCPHAGRCPHIKQKYPLTWYTKIASISVDGIIKNYA